MDAIKLNDDQQAAIRRMMEAVVARDETVVADLLRCRPYPENVYAAPSSYFWKWSDDYGGGRLNLVMPPGDVKEWGVWGFPTSGRVPGELTLHAEVWADWGQTDLTIQFRLIPDGARYRVELDDMHVM